jgi:hypothetical protein
VLAVAALLVPAAPASAAPVVDLNCTNDIALDINPGITLEPQHLDLTTGGLTGTANCTGTVDGQPVTGPGQISIMNQLIASCTSASGHGEFVLRVPTTGGIMTVAGQYAVEGTALIGDLTGTATITSAEGDCVTTPVTHATTVQTVHVS